MAMIPGGRGRRWPLRTASAVALLVALLATAALTWGAHSIVDDQEQRLLKERAAELNLLLTSSIDAIPMGLSAQGGILKATSGSRAAYEAAASEAVAAGPGELTFAWLQPAKSGDGWVVRASSGDGLANGDVITDARSATFNRALDTSEMIATAVVGADRRLGFVLGPPAAPAGTVLYRETALGPLKAPQAAGTAPFAELDVVIYDSRAPRPSAALATTTTKLPLTGDFVNRPLDAGISHWLTSVKAKRPLVGDVASKLWWITLLVGIAGSLLLAAVIETVARRRDDALSLYAAEHHVAETLQRSLLPQLPSIEGLELAARYLAGGSGQEVGGDWFDAFPIAGGRVGIAVGDVIGHDLAAASAMAQIRAALRAFALDGDPPATVVNRLDHLVNALGLTQLVTAIYGVLGPPEADGSRLLTYTNAGHLPPMLREPDGSVRQLSGDGSILIGAPIPVDHTQLEQRLVAGATLLLFTDGLVEVPGRPLEDSLDELIEALAADVPTDGLDSVCDRILATTADRVLRDDVALLAIRIGERQPV